MKEENNAIQNEIRQMAQIKEPNNLEDGWLGTDTLVEAVSDFEMFSEQLKRVIEDPCWWKWTIIALHSGIQGMMVLALKGSNGLNVLRKEDKKRYLDWYRGGRSDESRPRDLKLAGFLELYKKIKGDKMKMFCHSQKFVPKRTQGRSIKDLNCLRNKYIHFTPKSWVLELGGLPAMASDCLEIAEFLAWQSGNVLLWQPGLKKRLKAAFTSAHKSLSAVEKAYDGGTS